MLDRRIEPRMLCADIVEIQWKDQKTGRIRRAMANLDDISRSGACLLVDQLIPVKTPLRIVYPNGELTGKVSYCVLREVGYITGVEFDPGCQWSQRNYRPRHLLDSRRPDRRHP